MFAKKTVLSLAAGALIAAALPAFAQQHWWGVRDGYRYRGFAQPPSAAGLTFDQWAAVTAIPDGSMTWAQRLARDNDPNNDFGEGERERLAQARALYQAAGGWRY